MEDSLFTFSFEDLVEVPYKTQRYFWSYFSDPSYEYIKNIKIEANFFCHCEDVFPLILPAIYFTSIARTHPR